MARLALLASMMPLSTGTASRITVTPRRSWTGAFDGLGALAEVLPRQQQNRHQEDHMSVRALSRKPMRRKRRTPKAQMPW
jgi:hypothetical protein